MFLLHYFTGLIRQALWILGFKVSGSAPSFMTSYWAYGWLGFHYKHRHNPLHICPCNKVFRKGA